MDYHEWKNNTEYFKNTKFPTDEQVKRFLRRMRRKARSGKHGEYPTGKAEFDVAFKEGLADNLMWWRAKNGDYFSLWQWCD